MKQYPEIIKDLMTFGDSRAEISQKLRSLGMNVDQSTIAKWEKEENPGEKMRQKVARALKLLSDSRDVFERVDTLGDVQALLASVLALKSLESLKDVAKFDLFVVIQELQNEGVRTLTVFQLLEVITYAVTTGEIDPRKMAKYLRLQQG